MRDGNVRVREKFELSLDGRQIASIVVGALVILAVVFVLGLNVGRQMAARQAAAVPRGDLAALDQVPAGEAQAKLTFYDQLPKGRPPAPPPPHHETPDAPPVAPAPTPAPSAAAAVADAAPAGGSTVTASVSERPAPEAADAPAASAAPAAKPAPHPAAGSPSSHAAGPGGPFTIQLAAAPTRADAERIVAKYPTLSARIEAADVAGKGRVYRVRAGRFPDRPSAERYLKDAVRETGAKGFVAESR